MYLNLLAKVCVNHNIVLLLYQITVLTLGNPKLEMKAIEHQIISSYSHHEIRELLMKMSMKSANRSICKINPRWELPIPLQSVLTSLPRGEMILFIELRNIYFQPKILKLE